PRVEYYGEKTAIPTDEAAFDMLEAAADWFEDHAELHKARTGLEAIVRRSYEHLTKVSTILAIGEGVRTMEHVRWAFEYVMQDLEAKLSLAMANMDPTTSDALASRVLDAAGDGERRSTIIQRVSKSKQYRKEDVEKMLDSLVASGDLAEDEVKHPKNGTVSYRYRRY